MENENSEPQILTSEDVMGYTVNLPDKSLLNAGSLLFGVSYNTDHQKSSLISSDDKKPQKIKSILKVARVPLPEKQECMKIKLNMEEAERTSSDVNTENESFMRKKIISTGNHNKDLYREDKHGSSIVSFPVLEQAKKVRFSFKSHESPVQESCPPVLISSTDQVVRPKDQGVHEGHPPTVELQGLFSDDEKEGNLSMEQGISSQISRIENLLKGDRLRTNGKRKFPV